MLAEFLSHSLHLCVELIYDFKHYVPDQQKLKHCKLVKVEVGNIRNLKKKAYNSEAHCVGEQVNNWFGLGVPGTKFIYTKGKLQAPILKSQISNLKFQSTIIPFCKLEPGTWNLSFGICFFVRIKELGPRAKRSNPGVQEIILFRSFYLDVKRTKTSRRF